jgi:hypothetical protein
MAMLTAQRELDTGAGAEIMAEFDALSALRSRVSALSTSSTVTVPAFAATSVAGANPMTPAKGPVKSADGGGKSAADGKGGKAAAEVAEAAVTTPVLDAASIACIANWNQGVFCTHLSNLKSVHLFSYLSSYHCIYSNCLHCCFIHSGSIDLIPHARHSELASTLLAHLVRASAVSHALMPTAAADASSPAPPTAPTIHSFANAAKKASVSKLSDHSGTASDASVPNSQRNATESGNDHGLDEFAIISALAGGSGDGGGSSSASADLRSATVGIVAHACSILTQMLVSSSDSSHADGVDGNGSSSARASASSGTGSATVPLYTSANGKEHSSNSAPLRSTLIYAVLHHAPTIDRILSLVTSHVDASVRRALAAGLFRFAVIAQRRGCQAIGTSDDAAATAAASGTLVKDDESSASSQPLISLLNRVWAHTLPLSDSLPARRDGGNAQRRYLNEAFSLLQASFAFALSSPAASSSSASSPSLHSPLSLSSRLDHLLALLSSLPAGRETVDAEDAVVRGYIGLFAALLHGCPAWPSQRQPIDTLIKRALFALPPASVSSSSSESSHSSDSTSSLSLYPCGWVWASLCEHKSTRAAAFALLHQLGSASASNAAYIQRSLGEVLYPGGGRSRSRHSGQDASAGSELSHLHSADADDHDEDDGMDATIEAAISGTSSSSSPSSAASWSLQPDDDRRLTHVGLRNLGATCYINSLIQQLFHAPGFADDIESLEFVDEPSSSSSSSSQDLPTDVSMKNNSGGADNDDGRRMLAALQTAFRCMHRSQRRAHDIGAFIGTLRDWEGQRINVQQQQDVNEVHSVG